MIYVWHDNTVLVLEVLEVLSPLKVAFSHKNATTEIVINFFAIKNFSNEMWEAFLNTITEKKCFPF